MSVLLLLLALQVDRQAMISAGAPHVEPTIAAHPTDSRVLIATASEVIDGVGIVAKAFFSDDGGQRWREVALPGMRDRLAEGTLVHALDNWIIFSAGGTAYLSTLAWTEEDEKRLSIFLYRSKDSGRTWLSPVIVRGRTFDRPSVAALSRDGDERVALATAVSSRDQAVSTVVERGSGFAVFLSEDGGEHFQPPAFIAKDDLGHNSMNALYAASGTLLVPFVDYPGNASHALRSSRIYVARFGNFGKTFVGSSFVAEVARPFPGHAQIARDEKSGRLFIAWNGGTQSDRDIRVAYSDDEGLTWSAERSLRVAGKGPAMRPAIAVNRRGEIAVVFVQHEKGERAGCWQPFLSMSADGGRTFQEPQPVSDLVSCGETPANRAVKIAPGTSSVVDRWEDGGDYIGIAADADGAFHPVWVETRSGAFQVHTARVSSGEQ